ncbi:MAG: PilX N-terminal domain-containing pilus assembly protein, partial [Patescibacteria group bacterium]
MGNLKKNQQGAIAILVLLGISVVTLTVMTSMILLATSEVRMASAQTATEQTFYAAEAGINEALYRLINDTSSDFTMQLDTI